MTDRNQIINEVEDLLGSEGSHTMAERVFEELLSRVPTPALAAELLSRPGARAELGRMMRPAAPRTKVLLPCPHCGEVFGARDMRVHIPQCLANRNRRGVRKPGKPCTIAVRARGFEGVEVAGLVTPTVTGRGDPGNGCSCMD
jgi:hypothetical protein